MKTTNLMRDEQGIAFPMALIVMAILAALMAAFAVLATSEPQIASNQMHSVQARALAESGVERALWALTQGEASTPPSGALVNSGPPNYTVTMVAPYDGSQEVTQGVGSFKVTVTSGAAPNIKIVTAVGFVPNATHPVAIKKIVTQVTRLKWIDPVCGLCAGGEQGGVGQENSATFPSGMLLSNTDTATLKAMAKAQGTYYKGVPPWNGGVPPKNGLIFVDTTDGSVLTNSTPAANIPSLTIHGNGTWNGWLIVAGSVDISGNIDMSGLIYAQNDATLHGSGTGFITGAVITTNRVDTSSTNIDSQDTGNAPISYNCPAVRNGGGTLSQSWFVMPGTYRDVSGS